MKKKNSKENGSQFKTKIKMMISLTTALKVMSLK